MKLLGLRQQFMLAKMANVSRPKNPEPVRIGQYYQALPKELQKLIRSFYSPFHAIRDVRRFDDVYCRLKYEVKFNYVDEYAMAINLGLPRKQQITEDWQARIGIVWGQMAYLQQKSREFFSGYPGIDICFKPNNDTAHNFMMSVEEHTCEWVKECTRQED